MGSATVKKYSTIGNIAHIDSMLSARVQSGIENARKKGKKIGRPKKDAGDLPAKFWKYLPQYKKGEITVSDFARVLDCGRNTLYRYLEIADAKKKSDSGELPGQMTIEDIIDNKKEELYNEI